MHIKYYHKKSLNINDVSFVLPAEIQIEHLIQIAATTFTEIKVVFIIVLE